MELKNFYIDKSQPVSLKYGKQEIRQVFLSKELFYEQPINITINLSKGISSVVLTVKSTEEKTETHTLTQKSNVISVGYGYKIVFSNLVLQTNYSPSSNNPVMGKEYEVTKVSTYSFSASYIAPPVYYYKLEVILGTGGESVMYNGSRMTDSFSKSLAEGSRVSLSEPTPEKGYEFENYSINGNTSSTCSFRLENNTVVNVNFSPSSGPYTITVSASTDVWDYMIYVNGSVVAGGNGGTTESFKFSAGTVLFFSVSNKDGTVDSFSYTVTSDDYISL